MSHHITLIFADESLKIDKRIPHFRENGYVIIPYNEESRMEVDILRDLSKTGMTLKEIFEAYIE